jgi:phenylacetate-CoA ligase
MSVPLEKGLFRLCQRSIALDEEFQKQAVHRNFDQVDGALFQEYRLYRLKKEVAYAYEHSRFYRKKMDRHGVKPKDIQNWDDLQKLPFTTPGEIAAGGYDFLCISQGGVEKPVTYTSTGTTGPQKRFFFSTEDVENIKRFLGVGMNNVIDTNGTIQILLPNSNGRGIGSLLEQGCNDLGMHAYATGMMLPAEEQIRLTMEHHPQVWFGDTNTIYRATKEMEHKVDLSSLGLKVMFTTIGHLSPVMAKNLARIWNCDISTHYGLTETGWGLAVDCMHGGDGFHYNEFNVVAEVVDPETGKPVPEGQEGELVFTTLGREAMPLLRYRSHDLATLTSAPCPCGCHLQTMGKVHYRLESFVSLPRGQRIYPTLFDDKVYCFDEVIDYNLYLDRKKEKPTLLLDVEVQEGNEQRQELARAIEESVQELEPVRMVMGRPQVRLLPVGALKPDIYRKKMIREV